MLPERLFPYILTVPDISCAAGEFDLPGALSWGMPMKRFLKYAVAPCLVFLFLALLTLMLAPVLFNVQKFVPGLEKAVSEASGRQFSLGRDVTLSFFPWLSLSFSDMKLGNPPGFSDDTFLTVGSFEARVKVLPLFFGRVEVSRFVVGGLALHLETRADGSGNWQRGTAQETGKGVAAAAPWLKNLSAALFAVTDGQVQWRDGAGRTRRVDEIMLLVNDFSPYRAASIDARAAVAGKPLEVTGQVGPLLGGKDGEIALDLGLQLPGGLRGRVQGTLAGRGAGGLTATYEVEEFSPRTAAATWGWPRMLPGLEGEAFTRASGRGRVSFAGGRLLLDNGSGKLDDTSLTYTLAMGDVSMPRLEMTVALDQVDLSRYTAMPTREVGERPGEAGGERALPGLAGEGTITIGELRHGGIVARDVILPVHVEEGRLLLNRASGELAGGQVLGDLSWNFAAQLPGLEARLDFDEVDGGMLLGDLFKAGVLRGKVSGEVSLQRAGPEASSETERWRGEARLRLGQGALMGIALGNLASPSSEGDSGRTAPSAAPEMAADRGDALEISTPFSSGTLHLGLDHGVLQFRECQLTVADGELQLAGVVDLSGRRLELEAVTSGAVTVVDKRGREERTSRSVLSTITGPFDMPRHSVHPGLAASRLVKRETAASLLAETLPTPAEEGLGPLVGKNLVDPVVVAERFHLQPVHLKPVEMKRKMTLGSGRVRIGEIRQEESLR